VKKIYSLVIFIALFFPILVSANEVTGYVTTTETLMASSDNKEKPNNSCMHKENGKYSSIYAVPGRIHCLDAGDQVKVLNYSSIIPSTLASCKTGYYKVQYTNPKGVVYTGYVCGDFVKTEIDTTKYQEEFKTNNIPEIYWDKLALLKELHPNWKFTGYKTGLNWEDVLNNESIVGMNYIQSSNPIYLSLDEGSYNASTNTYNMMEAGGFYAANKKTVAYYMDPRNFFDEKNIFMFENLGYNEKYQTRTVLETILKNTDLYQYIDKFIQAATFNGNNVSPIMLAARSKQEIVLSSGKLTRAATGEAGYYNFYNLGAFSSCENPIECAINFASGYDGAYTTFNRPWTTAEAAILNGAQYIANGYINQKQNTLYFQKFNVTSNSYGNYSHQYMTNIQAPTSEAKSTQSSYASIDGLLNSEIEFIIPVYENMPEVVSVLPTQVDKEAIEDKKEQQTVINISEVLTDAGYKATGEYLANVKINTKAKDVLANLKKIEPSITFTIIRDNKEIIGDEALGTADILKIKTAETESSFRLIIYGDANGDGKITAVDYVKIKNYIMQSSGLTGSFKEAADANKDGKITAVDYVNVKNFIMGNNSTLN